MAQNQQYFKSYYLSNQDDFRKRARVNARKRYLLKKQEILAHKREVYNNKKACIEPIGSKQETYNKEDLYQAKVRGMPIKLFLKEKQEVFDVIVKQEQRDVEDC